MYCIIIQKANGKLIREASEDKPDVIDIEYWENFYSILVEERIENAIVINIYEVNK